MLDTPSMPSAKAAQSLLLDVVRIGTRLVAVGERGHIVYSDNDGRDWSQAQVPVATTLTAVHFPIPTRGWAVGHSGVILHSDDAGQTWTKQFDGLAANNAVIAQNERTVAALEAKLAAATGAQAEALEGQLDDAVMALEDSKADAEDGASKPFLDVWFTSSQQGYVVGAYGLFFGTTDGGKTWTNLSNRLANPDRLHLNGITEVPGGDLFIVGEAGNIFRSDNGGGNWRKLDGPYDGSLFDVVGTGVTDEVLVMGLRGNMFRSEDQGVTWTKVKTGPAGTLTGGVHDNRGRVTIVGNSGTVLTSNNYGRSFELHTRSDRLSLSGIAYLPDQRLILVGEGGAKRVSARGEDAQ